MTISAIFNFLLALFKIIPVLKGFWDDLVTMYIERQIENLKAENKAAIRKAIDEKDQRDIEKLLGSDHTGMPSGISGTTIVHTLPNVGKLQDGDKK